MTITLTNAFLLCMVCGVLSGILVLTLFQYYQGPVSQLKRDFLSATSYLIVSGLLTWGAWELWGMMGVILSVPAFGLGGGAIIATVNDSRTKSNVGSQSNNQETL